MSVVEGSGIFKCAHESHEKEFTTTDLKKFNEHITKGNHTYYGTAPCAVCDAPVNFESLPVGKKPVCKKCKEELS
jgi:uncharacterized paraquat-inducible protein A